MQFALWIMACALIVVASGRRTYIPLLIVPILWFTIPWIASELLTGIPSAGLGPIPSMHPASWLVLVIFGLRIPMSNSGFTDVIRANWGAFVTIGIVVLVALLTTIAGSGVRGITSIVYVFICPIIFAVLVLAEHKRSNFLAGWLRNLVLAISTAQAVLAVMQSLTGSVIFFESYYERQYWWSSGIQRVIGSTDHPLMLSMLMCAGMALTVGIRSLLLRVALPILFLVTVVMTGSRLGVVIGAIVLGWLLLAGRLGWLPRLFLLCVVGVTIGLTLKGAVLGGAFSRFGDDSGSTRVRLLAYELFGQVWPDYLVIGGGATHSYDLLAAAGLTTSFESAALTYAVEIGVVPTMLYFFAMIVLVMAKRSGEIRAVSGGCVAFIAVFVIFQSYSGGTLQSSATSLLWLIVALAVARTPRNDHARETSDRAMIS